MKSQKSDSNHPPWNKSALQEDEHSVKILQARGALSLTLKPDGVKGGRGADSVPPQPAPSSLCNLFGISGKQRLLWRLVVLLVGLLDLLVG